MTIFQQQQESSAMTPILKIGRRLSSRMVSPIEGWKTKTSKKYQSWTFIGWIAARLTSLEWFQDGERWAWKVPRCLELSNREFHLYENNDCELVRNELDEFLKKRTGRVD